MPYSKSSQPSAKPIRCDPQAAIMWELIFTSSKQGMDHFRENTLDKNHVLQSPSPPKGPHEMPAIKQDQMWTFLEQHHWTYPKSPLLCLQKKTRLGDHRKRRTHVDSMQIQWTTTSVGHSQKNMEQIHG